MCIYCSATGNSDKYPTTPCATHDSSVASSKATLQQDGIKMKRIPQEKIDKETNDRFHDTNNRAEGVLAQHSSECSSLKALSDADRAQKKLQDAIQDLQDTKERNEQVEKELEVLSKSVDEYVTELRGHVQYADYYQIRLAMAECKLDVSELTYGFEDFVERRRLKKEAGRGVAFLATANDGEKRRWKKKLGKAGEEVREARIKMKLREQKARSAFWSWR